MGKKSRKKKEAITRVKRKSFLGRLRPTIWKVAKVGLPVLVIGGATAGYFLTRPSASELELRAFVNDKRHELVGPGIAYTHQDSPSLVFEGPKDFCQKCHDFKNVSRKISQDIRKHYEAIKKYYPVQFNPEDLLVTFVHNLERKEGEVFGTAQMERTEITMRTSVAASALKDETMIHELAHLSVNQPDHLVNEIWASVAPYLIHPEYFSRFSKNVGTGRYANRFIIDYLHRAALFSGGQVPQFYSKRRPDKTTIISDVVRKRFSGFPSAQGYSLAANAYSEAMHHYLENHLYWDRALSSLRDPQVLPDFFIARHLFQAKDPKFLSAYSNINYINRVLMIAQQEIKQPQFDIRQINSVTPGSNLRSNVQSAFSESHMSEADVDYIYLAGVFSLLGTKTGEFNKAPFKREQIERLANQKADFLEKEMIGSMHKLADSLRAMPEKEYNERLVASKLRAIEKQSLVFRNRIKELRNYR